MKNLIGTLASIILMLIVVAGPAFAQAPPPPPPPPGGGPGGHMGPPPEALLKETLGLTDEQMTALTALLETRRQSAEPIFIQLKEAEDALQELLQSPDPDQAKIDELKQTIANLQKQLDQINAVCQAGFKGLLTEAQQAFVAEALALEKKVSAAHAMRAMGLVAPPSTTESGAGYRQCPKRAH